MTVAATQERLDRTFRYLRRLADQGLPAPTNKDIAIHAIKMGRQNFQPWDRTQGIKWPKCEHGAVMISGLEYCGLIEVERGPYWRRIRLIETGQVLEPRPRRIGRMEERFGSRR
jgi:hypothetical protein